MKQRRITEATVTTQDRVLLWGEWTDSDLDTQGTFLEILTRDDKGQNLWRSQLMELTGEEWSLIRA